MFLEKIKQKARGYRQGEKIKEGEGLWAIKKIIKEVAGFVWTVGVDL